MQSWSMNNQAVQTLRLAVDLTVQYVWFTVNGPVGLKIGNKCFYTIERKQIDSSK